MYILAALHLPWACLQNHVWYPGTLCLSPLHTSAGTQLFVSAGELRDWGGQLHVAPSEGFICQCYYPVPVLIPTCWDQTSPGSSGTFWLPVLLTVILIVQSSRRAGHALCAAQPGTTGLKELLLKSMSGTGCQDLGFKCPPIANPPHSSVPPAGFRWPDAWDQGAWAFL